MSNAAIFVAQIALRYFRDDLAHAYGLREEASITLHGDGIGIGSAEAGALSIISNKGGNTVTLVAKPFEARSRFWNGPNVVPDTLKDGSLESSLWHDLIWQFAPCLSKQLGISTHDLLTWSNGILAAAWEYYGRVLYGRSAESGKRRGWLAYNVCRLGAWVKRLLLRFSILAFVTLLAGCSGCYTPPDWTVSDASAIEAVEGG